MLRLTTVGRLSGKKRVAILAFIQDGPNLVVPAMNGWADPEPAWWLNLQANPNATVELPDGTREVTARSAVGGERSRLWASFVDLGSSAFTDANAALRSRETALVVLEPCSNSLPPNKAWR
jgi:deazaflavin-dependent oxidoreductase (nitroreductase family)